MSKVQPTSSDRHRFHFLDGLRGIASASIVPWHAPLYLGTRNVFHGCFLAVDFFFCLSGFVIAFSYEKRIVDGLKVGDFFVMRLIRLYAIYWLGTMLGFLLLLVDLGLENVSHLKAHLLALFLLSLAVLPGFHWINSYVLFPLDAPAWSLFVELLANVALAWLIFKHLAKIWVLIFIAVLSLLLLIRWIGAGNSVDVGWANGSSHFALGMARMLLSFTIGILLMRLLRHMPRTCIHGWYLPVAISLLLVLLLVAPFAVLQTESFHLLAVVVLFPVMVYFGALAYPPESWTRACVFLGDTSYPLYLLHLTFIRVFSFTWVASFLSHNSFLSEAAVAIVTLIAMIASYGIAKIYDEPLRKFLFKKYTASVQQRLSTV